MQERATDAGAGTGSTLRVVVERPPPGLARGKVAWPPWGIGLLGGSLVFASLAYLIWRYRRLWRR